MKKIKRKLLNFMAKFNNQGSAFVDLAVKIGVGVIAGSIIIKFLNGNLETVLGSLFTRIQTIFESAEIQ